MKPEPPRPGKSVGDQIEEVRAIAELAANRAEIACRFSERAEGASFRTEEKVEILRRETAAGIARIAEAVRPAHRVRVYALCIAIALVVSFLTTCYTR